MNLRSKKDCKQFKILLIKLVDDEISPEEQTRLDQHLSTCRECQNDLNELRKWKEVSHSMKGKLLPDMAWDEYWRNLYNRLERGISWILISVGAIILLGIAAYHFVLNLLEDTQLGLLEKLGIFALVFGFVILFVSVTREKLMVRKHDKYKEIIR